MNVKIKTRKVGQNFAVTAEVVANNNRVIHCTRNFPSGFAANAEAAARQWAEKNGHKIIVDRA